MDLSTVKPFDQTHCPKVKDFVFRKKTFSSTSACFLSEPYCWGRVRNINGMTPAAQENADMIQAFVISERVDTKFIQEVGTRIFSNIERLRSDYEREWLAKLLLSAIVNKDATRLQYCLHSEF